jgi:hypothetical protein
VLWNYFHLTLFFLLSLLWACGFFLLSPRATPNQPEPTKNMKNTNTTNMKFPYYTGDCGLGLDPSEGSWDGHNKFTTPEGQEWYLLDEEADTRDGNGIVWLFGSPTRTNQ